MGGKPASPVAPEVPEREEGASTERSGALRPPSAPGSSLPVPSAHNVDDNASPSSISSAPPPPPLVPPVKVGAILRCLKFEEERGVAGRVDSIHSTQPMIMLFILGLNIYWPITFEDVRGDTWVHVPGNYPLPGADLDFDERCRTPHPPHVNPLISPTDRRRARRRHAWAYVTTDVGVPGFTLNGEEKLRWRGPAKEGERGELGEFHTSALHDSPSCFILATDDEE